MELNVIKIQLICTFNNFRFGLKNYFLVRKPQKNYQPASSISEVKEINFTLVRRLHATLVHFCNEEQSKFLCKRERKLTVQRKNFAFINIYFIYNSIKIFTRITGYFCTENGSKSRRK